MKVNCLLVSFPGMLLSPECFLPDNGLANLAGALLDSNHNVEIWDFGTSDTVKILFPDGFAEGYGRTSDPTKINERLELLNNLEKYQENIILNKICANLISHIKNNNISFLGFKLWHGDGFYFTMQMIKKIKKECPKVMIFAGGPHVDIYREDILKYQENEIEALVYGEGENVISLLADYSLGKIPLSEIPNIIYKENNVIKINPQKFVDNLNNLPYPVYNAKHYLAMEGNNKIKLIVLDESRGCNRTCYFCIHPIKSGRNIRIKSPDRVVNEIKKINNEIGTAHFRLAGSNTPVNFLINFSKFVINEKLNISYDSFAHIGKYANITDNELKIIKNSGCDSLFFGLESGSDKILKKSMNKGFTAETAKHVLKKVKNAGIDVIVSLIYPAPFETSETTKETVKLLCEVDPASILLSMPGFFKGNMWTKKPEKFGIELPGDFFDNFIKYKLKFLYPPQYWDPLVYKVNGRSSQELMFQHLNIRNELKNKGLSVGVTEIINTLSKLVGRDKNEAVGFWQQNLFTGRWDAIQNEIEKINKAVLL